MTDETTEAVANATEETESAETEKKTSFSGTCPNCGLTSTAWKDSQKESKRRAKELAEADKTA